MKLTIEELYNHLYNHLGPQGWWPAEDKIEIIIGAILVQNTNWRNVERSLSNIRIATQFNPEELLKLSEAELQELIRPSGFYKNKARAINAVITWLQEHHYDFKAIDRLYTTELRNELLKLRGIGFETADVLLVYVFDRVVFIADTYTRRLFTALGVQSKDYRDLYSKVKLPEHFTTVHAQEFHGLLDEFGKRYTTTKGIKEKTFLDDYFVK